MLYHSFRTDAEPRVIGVKDGLSQVKIQSDGFANTATYEELESFWAPSTYWQKLNHTPPRRFVIEYAMLRPKAKLTDFLGFSPFFMGCPFMLSGKAKELFAKYDIQPHFLFDVLIYDKTSLVTRDYSLFYAPFLGYEVIDFAKSRFRSTLGQALTFVNQEAYESYRNTQHTIPEVESLAMGEAFNTNLDFFQCRLGPMFMSEQLKQAVERAGLTNIVFSSKRGSSAFAE